MSEQKELDTLHHAALRVKDVKEAVQWYTERFRCEVEYQDATWAMLAFENVRLAFVLAGTASAAHCDPGRSREHSANRSDIAMEPLRCT